LPQTQFRQGVEDTQHAVLTDIYQEDTNMVVWKRNLANNLEQAADAIIESQPTLEELLVVSP
jgi:predicted nucleic acid-binding protein